jgi:hypothetical protein
MTEIIETNQPTYEGVELSVLTGLFKNGDREAMDEILYRESEYIFYADPVKFVLTGVGDELPLSERPVRPKDKQPKPPRPGVVGGGSGGSW